MRSLLLSMKSCLVLSCSILVVVSGKDEVLLERCGEGASVRWECDDSESEVHTRV